MAVLLKNVQINTSRSPAYSSSSGTKTPIAHLTEVQGHIRTNAATAFVILPEPAIEADYVLTAETGTDILENDIVTSITLIANPSIHWPSMSTAPNANEIIMVNYVKEVASGILPARYCYLKREVVGGAVTA